MAPKKKKYSELSDSAKYFRNNPDARKKKNAISKKVNARKSQKKKRSELEKKRRAAKKRGTDTSKTDYDHAVGRRVSVKANRGRKNGTKGDRNARGKGSSKKIKYNGKS